LKCTNYFSLHQRDNDFKVVVIMVVVPVAPVFHTMLASSNYALESAMACQVFRAVRLGFIEDFPASTMAPHGPQRASMGPLIVQVERNFEPDVRSSEVV
jgi:hypothetical protein